MLTKRQTLKGRFTIAAKHHITIAEIYETELVDIEKKHHCLQVPGWTHQILVAGV